MVYLIIKLCDFAVYPLNSVVKQLGQRFILIGFAGRLWFPEAGAFKPHLPKHHFWMLNKIAVHRNAVFVRIQIDPIWLNINYTVTLLQNENIACDLCACIGTESVIWQTDCA